VKDDNDPPVTAISLTEKPVTGSLAVNVKFNGLSFVEGGWCLSLN